MKIINPNTIIELTEEEYDTIYDFINLFVDKNYSLQNVWDIMIATHDKDDEVLNDYGYSLKILDN